MYYLVLVALVAYAIKKRGWGRVWRRLAFKTLPVLLVINLVKYLIF